MWSGDQRDHREWNGSGLIFLYLFLCFFSLSEKVIKTKRKRKIRPFFSPLRSAFLERNRNDIV